MYIEQMKFNPVKISSEINSYLIMLIGEMILMIGEKPCIVSLAYRLASGEISCVWNEENRHSPIHLSIPCIQSSIKQYEMDALQHSYLTHIVGVHCLSGVGEVIPFKVLSNFLFLHAFFLIQKMSKCCSIFYV